MRAQMVTAGAAAVLLLLASGTPTSGQESPRPSIYRKAGMSIGLIHKRLTGSGRQDRWNEETQMVEMIPSDNRAMWGLSFGGHIWSQRTSLQFEFARTGEDWIYDEPFPDLVAGTVDTSIYLHYTTLGFRLRQALITRRLNATVGHAWIEEGRTRRASGFESQSFPGDVFPMWSWGLDLRLNEALLLGFVRERSYDHLHENDSVPIEGWTSNSIHLTLIF